MAQQDFDGQEDLGTGGKLKNWIQDNIRIIISVLIVIAIAGGIYSYSNRGQGPSEEELALEEEFNIEQGEQEAANQEAESEEGGEEVAQTQEQEQEEQTEGEEQQQQQEEEVQTPEEGQASESVSEETQDAFIQTAASGDSETTLARKALAGYLEKNNDPSLTPEHKVYIEDYLRKHVNQPGSLNVGNKMTFSKTLIQNSIEKAKTLTESQLENLKKYSSRVPSLQ
ncbi:MAG: hypothetical protein U5L10_05660 [Candidatus Moranbacteria bacterium]|nr:hypothetical protein [Candidatus Moranbacteria bacterium]